MTDAGTDDRGWRHLRGVFPVRRRGKEHAPRLGAAGPVLTQGSDWPAQPGFQEPVGQRVNGFSMTATARRDGDVTRAVDGETSPRNPSLFASVG